MNSSFTLNASSLWQAIKITFGQCPAQSGIWLLLLIFRALSIPILVWLTGHITDVVTTSESLDVKQYVVLSVLWLASLTVGSALSPWISYLQASIGEASLITIQLRLINSINSIPDLNMLEKKSFYHDLSFAQRNLETTPVNFVFQCEATLESGITIVALLSIIGSFSWLVATIVLISAVPHVLMRQYLAKINFWNARMATQEWQEIQYCASSINDPSFAKETRLFHNTKFFSEKTKMFFSLLNDRLIGEKYKSTVYPIPTIILLQAGAVISLIIFVQDFKASIIGAGAFVILLQSLYSIQRKLESATETFNLIFWNLLTFKAVFRIFEVKPAIVVASNPIPIESEDNIEIFFDKVCFSYPGGPRILKDLSFTWKFGEKLALVGENGSGKSTVVKLLLRFYDPDSGVIYVNNRPIEEYDLKQWRGLIAAVFQDFGRYEYSIFENMYFDNPSKNIFKSETDKILDQCGLLKVVENLPEGIETRLGKRFGTSDLSGGQWQKLAIARAMCKRASIMIWDEPTAALDPNIESEIYRLFETLSKGKSTLMITHRLGATAMADKILVLSGGHIVESGSHEELINSNGMYMKMFLKQASWYDR
jgi:ATP-binding cassette, subfamily B, bacterial